MIRNFIYKNTLALMFLAFGVVNCSAQEVLVKQFEFSTSSRGGGYEKITVTKEEVAIAKGQRRSAQNKEVVKRKITDNDWQAFQKSVMGLDFKEINALKSPTMDRAFDGASHSSLVITPFEGEEVSHAFDNENPHEKLKPLMQQIMKWRGGKVKK